LRDEPNLDESIDSPSVAGLGIFPATQFATRSAYERVGSENVLRAGKAT
jgi:hypothetical protein